MTDTAQPGMAWADIANSAYKAYAAVTGNKNFRGEQMPAFEELPPMIQKAWEAAARQAYVCLDDKMDGTPPDERRWANWEKP